jgi:hypothetical protein
MPHHHLELDIQAQPDDVTCGPTCLQAVYRYFGDSVRISDVIREVTILKDRGTLTVYLACHALRRGYGATIWTYNLELFDPSWFPTGADALASKLRAQAAVKHDPELLVATAAYVEFLELGGLVEYRELTPDLIRGPLRRGRPILTGLNATYLYGCAREIDDGRIQYDDILGSSMGHFVVLHGYDPDTREVLVADPLRDNPRYSGQRYRVSVHQLIGAILLGVLTYDGSLLVLSPPDEEAEGAVLAGDEALGGVAPPGRPHGPGRARGGGS